MMVRKPKAIALYSGGLDSTLAILVMMRHGVEVEALKFLTHFGCDLSGLSSCGSDPYPAAEKFGFTVKLSHLGWKFVDIVKNPRYGHGKNMNPCIDCRLLMLKEAKDYMEMTGGDFIITGEVVSQRPMSQMRNHLNMIAKKCGLEGRLVRPLSGKLLPPTIPEKWGLIKREWLLDIQGRSRKRQMALAEEFGLKDYPSPAGGCLLTDRQYSKRIKDLFTFEAQFDFNDLNLLKVGRQFRLSEKCKLILGRNKEENETILSLSKKDDYILEVKDSGSPIGLLRGDVNRSQFELAASITARYSDAKDQYKIKVEILKGSQSQDIWVSPADYETLERVRI